eukprot:6122679-Heterocapsa_arctica.AAC.1
MDVCMYVFIHECVKLLSAPAFRIGGRVRAPQFSAFAAYPFPIDFFPPFPHSFSLPLVPNYIPAASYAARPQAN